MKIHGVSACWSGKTYEDAISLLNQGTIEPILGQLSVEHVQLCPQHQNILTPSLITQLMQDFPHIQFRLHSDVRVPKKTGYTLDLIHFDDNSLWYFQYINDLSKQINAPLYSLHAGVRKGLTLLDLFKKYEKLQSIFHCPIAIEGHYPYKNDHYLIFDWKEYEQLYLSGCNYALDLSHLNIVAEREGWNWNLTEKMITSHHCKEIHVSFNEGIMDSHILSHQQYEKLWQLWKPLIELKNDDCIVFSEGNQSLEQRKLDKINSATRLSEKL